MFRPPGCPYRSCARHLKPEPGFCVRYGVYRPHCRHYPVQRYRCRACGRTFSRQTFRADRGQKKPFLNAAFMRLMVSCVGLRQAARVLQVARRTVEHRFRWLARHAADYHRNRLGAGSLLGPFQLDELETFESNRYQPVTVPVLIDRDTLFIVATSVAPLRRKGRLTALQRRDLAAREALAGRRPSSSGRAVTAVLAPLRGLVGDAPIVLDSDYKPLYGALGRRLFGARFVWRRHSATVRRDRDNPLFPINHTNARMRHFLSRLRRRTWCVSKRRAALQGHLNIAALWANYCRGMTNRTRVTPAQALHLAPEPRSPEQILGWREDWRTRGGPTARAGGPACRRSTR